MSKRQLLLLSVIIILLSSCQSKTKNNLSEVEKSMEKIKAETDEKFKNALDTIPALEETILNPQYDDSKIKGFGIFKIGSSIENTINELLHSKEYKFDSASTHEKKSKLEVGAIAFSKDNSVYSKKYIVKINHPKSTFDRINTIEEASWCRDVEIYWITLYTVDKVNIKDLYLTYYKNKLVRIVCDRFSDGLEDAVVSKYGKADDSYATPGYYHSFWINKDLRAGYSKSDFNHDFEIIIKGGQRFLSNCNSQDFDEQSKIDQANKKEELGKF